jgi:flagellin
MSLSINTNNAALVALQGLNSITTQLNAVTKQVNTGYKVNDALDDGAAFAVAQGLRGDISTIGAVTTQLQNSQGLIQVANTAGTQISNSLNDLKGVIATLANTGLTSTQRTQYQSQYTAIKSQIDGYISNASFNGQNLLNTSKAVTVISTASGGTLTITAFDLTGSSQSGASVSGLLGTSAPATAAAAQALLTGSFVTAQTNIGTALSSYGAANTAINNQVTYLQAVSDATTSGLGAIVDADLSKESAKLQSLQISQQLATQTLSIANQQPSILLNLFK